MTEFEVSLDVSQITVKADKIHVHSGEYGRYGGIRLTRKKGWCRREDVAFFPDRDIVKIIRKETE